MPWIVPSEIVRVIGEFFPSWAPSANKPNVMLGIGQIWRIVAIVSLIDRLPEDLLMLPPRAYTDCVVDLENLRTKGDVSVA